ncbi:MAG: arylsulfate sulfotransferase [Verrucomicrobiota bacterium]
MLVALFALAALPGYSRSSRSRLPAGAPVVTVTGQTAGITPFIAQLQLSANPVAAVKSIRFEIAPKSGSVTRPISATYFREYLVSRGWINSGNGQINLSIFGLYANYTNTVNLTYCFADGSSQQETITVPTAQFSDPCGYGRVVRAQPRTTSNTLSYDFMLVKSNCGSYSPTILDTDGEVRWAGTTGTSSFESTLYRNGLYLADGATLMRMEFDGAVTPLADYTQSGVVAFHHNIDYGKRGIILEADTSSQTESFLIEVDAAGNVLKTWDLAAIISDEMTRGGDDPTQFVKPRPIDWFHNNAVTYKSSDDSLIVSSRENFVIALDYESGAIKWILGDPTKRWYQFPSLRKYALALVGSTLPPIGQHAVSITTDDNLLLFDDGKNSLNQTPAGTDRSYSTARKYKIDNQTMSATELWNDGNQALQSEYCSSVYEDHAENYLVDYAVIGISDPVIGSSTVRVTEIFGLDSLGLKVFDYIYYTQNCNTAWNAMPIHLEGVGFTGTDPLDPAGGWRVSSLARDASGANVMFPAIGGRSYRLEYKDELSTSAWSPVADYTHTSSCSDAEIVDPSANTRAQRFYRVRLLPP